MLVRGVGDAVPAGNEDHRARADLGEMARICPAAERMGMAGKPGDLMRFVNARNALGMLSERLGTDLLF